MTCKICQTWNHVAGKNGKCKNPESKKYGLTTKRSSVCDKFKAPNTTKHKKGTYLRVHQLRTAIKKEREGI